MPHTQAILDLSWGKAREEAGDKVRKQQLVVRGCQCGVAGVCPAPTSLSFLLCVSISYPLKIEVQGKLQGRRKSFSREHR